MNRLGLTKLRCPRCSGALELQPLDVTAAAVDGAAREAVVAMGSDASVLVREKVQTGALTCTVCDVWYPIVNGIPVMLLFRTALHDDFAGRHQARCRSVRLANAPRWDPEPGERGTQTLFTEEWLTTPTDELTFSHTEEDLRQLHQNVWLKWSAGAPESVKTVLDVGCGRGVESRVLRKIIPRAQVFGIDLNLSMIQRGYAFQGDPLLHLLVCSLFHPPFEQRVWDLVYSQGVIHHTYSTRAAFESVARFVSDEGYLFVWVYGLEDDHILGGTLGFLARATAVLGKVARPVLSRVPPPIRHVIINAASYPAHPVVRTRVKNHAQWTLKDTRHSLRDTFTPRYAHRHGFNQVIEWFEDRGFSYDVQSPSAFRKIFGKRGSGVGVLGRRLPPSSVAADGHPRISRAGVDWHAAAL